MLRTIESRLELRLPSTNCCWTTSENVDGWWMQEIRIYYHQYGKIPLEYLIFRMKCISSYDHFEQSWILSITIQWLHKRFSPEIWACFVCFINEYWNLCILYCAAHYAHCINRNHWLLTTQDSSALHKWMTNVNLCRKFAFTVAFPTIRM